MNPLGTQSNFKCEYADPGQSRCPEWRCDCFIETHPDDPHGLHPEDFTVRGGPGNGEICARCGKPAKGYAKIGDARYCHEGPDPTCYMSASWEMFNAGTHLVEVVVQRFEGDDVMNFEDPTVDGSGYSSGGKEST